MSDSFWVLLPHGAFQERKRDGQLACVLRESTQITSRSALGSCTHRKNMVCLAARALFQRCFPVSSLNIPPRRRQQPACSCRLRSQFTALDLLSACPCATAPPQPRRGSHGLRLSPRAAAWSTLFGPVRIPVPPARRLSERDARSGETLVRDAAERHQRRQRGEHPPSSMTLEEQRKAAFCSLCLVAFSPFFR